MREKREACFERASAMGEGELEVMARERGWERSERLGVWKSFSDGERKVRDRGDKKAK